jgi:competence protein ComEA
MEYRREGHLPLIDKICDRTGLSRRNVMLIVAVAALVLIAVLAFYVTQGSGSGFEVADSKSASAHDAGQEANSGEPVKAIVYVTGAVGAPGLYELTSDKRIGDAVAAAGGLSAEAAAESINLAEKITDGAQIHIPTKGEIAAKAATSSVPATASNGAGAQDGQKSTGAKGGASDLVNINTASANELQSINGIGSATAQKIVDYRNKNGAFKTKEDLKNVSGIGEKKYASIASQITV